MGGVSARAFPGSLRDTGFLRQRQAREAAMATALAKQLNLDVAKVKQALAELRPAGAK